MSNRHEWWTYQMVVHHCEMKRIEPWFVHSIDRSETELLMDHLIVAVIRLCLLLRRTQQDLGIDRPTVGHGRVQRGISSSVHIVEIHLSNEEMEWKIFTLSLSYRDRRYSRGAGPSQAAAKWIGRRSYLSRMLYSGMTESSCFKYFGLGLIAAQWIGVIYSLPSRICIDTNDPHSLESSLSISWSHWLLAWWSDLRRRREEPRRECFVRSCSGRPTWWWRTLKPWKLLALISSMMLAASFRWPAWMLCEMFS